MLTGAGCRSAARDRAAILSNQYVTIGLLMTIVIGVLVVIVGGTVGVFLSVVHSSPFLSKAEMTEAMTGPVRDPKWAEGPRAG